VLETAPGFPIHGAREATDELDFHPCLSIRNIRYCFQGYRPLVTDSIPRIARFATEPTTSLAAVAARFAQRFDAYADLLGLSEGSVLVADAGATVYFSRLRVYDLAGLYEPDVVRTLKHDTVYWLDDKTDFHRWVLEEIRPTFIATQAFWTYVAALETADRFLADYVPIEAAPDDYVAATFGVKLRSGIFVRRDALKAPEDVLRLRAA